MESQASVSFVGSGARHKAALIGRRPSPRYHRTEAPETAEHDWQKPSGRSMPGQVGQVTVRSHRVRGANESQRGASLGASCYQVLAVAN